MNYWNHAIACLFIAIISSILGFQTGYLDLSGLKDFWIGALPYTFVITCDLDSAKSLVRKLWGPLKIIWYPFVDAGHREILHHYAWGPFILISVLWVPITAYYGHLVVPKESIIGAVLMLGTHIVSDKIYSGYRAIVPDWIERKLRKVF